MDGLLVYKLEEWSGLKTAIARSYTGHFKPIALLSPTLLSLFHHWAHTLLRLFPFWAHTLLSLFHYWAHTLLRLFHYWAHTLLSLFHYWAHTLLSLFHYWAHTLLRLFHYWVHIWLWLFHYWAHTLLSLFYYWAHTLSRLFHYWVHLCWVPNSQFQCNNVSCFKTNLLFRPIVVVLVSAISLNNACLFCFQSKMPMTIKVVHIYTYLKMLVSTWSLNSHQRSALCQRNLSIHGQGILKESHKYAGSQTLHTCYCLVVWIQK